jgi:hypothetical protein
VNCVNLRRYELNWLCNDLRYDALVVLYALLHVVYSLLWRDDQLTKTLAEAVADLVVE